MNNKALRVVGQTASTHGLDENRFYFLYRPPDVGVCTSLVHLAT